MPKNLTKTQLAAVELLRSRLDPRHPMFSGDGVVAAALGGQARPYMDSWVLPLVDYLLKGESYYGQADEIRRDLANRRAAAAERARWAAVHGGEV